MSELAIPLGFEVEGIEVGAGPLGRGDLYLSVKYWQDLGQ